MILNDMQINVLCTENPAMIDPFVPYQVKNHDGQKVVSYGLSSFGYDIRLSNEFKTPLRLTSAIFDPHAPHLIEYADIENTHVVLAPGEMILAMSKESFCMPKDVMALCLGKSSLARMGIFCNVTPLEPGWRGRLTMEISNIGHMRVKIYAGEGIAQLVFFRGEPPYVTYADRAGKYMDQSEVTPMKL